MKLLFFSIFCLASVGVIGLKRPPADIIESKTWFFVVESNLDGSDRTFISHKRDETHYYHKLELKKNNKYKYGDESGSYSIEGSVLILKSSLSTRRFTIKFKSADYLTLQEERFENKLFYGVQVPNN